MSPNDREPFTTAEAHLGQQPAGLPRLVLEARVRLGPGATPAQVAAAIRAGGAWMATDEEVRQVWDEGHLPPE